MEVSWHGVLNCFTLRDESILPCGKVYSVMKGNISRNLTAGNKFILLY
jgi:hypothetical protein